MSYTNWEAEVTAALGAMLDVTNGDAQAIIEAQAFEMSRHWSRGSDAETTARAVESASRG